MFKKFQALGEVIKKMKPKVPKTETQKKIRDLKINTQKLKAGEAKLDQTIFEFKNPKVRGKKFTFDSSKKKTMKESDKKKQIMKDNAKVIGRMFKTALDRNKQSKKMFKTAKGDK